MANSWPFYVENGFTFKNSLLRGVKLTKNPDSDNYSVCGYSVFHSMCKELIHYQTVVLVRM